jgi:hypothetical protein
MERCKTMAILCIAVLGSAAPAALLADAAGDVAALEAQCAQEREARIKPLRDAEIAKCKADEHNDPAYCERFWASYGDAYRRPNGTLAPRLFDDLPICQKAYRARRELEVNG